VGRRVHALRQLRIGTGRAEQCLRDGTGAAGAGASHHHAQVLAAHPDADRRAARCFLDRTRDLLGQVFLDLQSPGVACDDPGDLGQAQDLPVRSVGGGCGDVEREEMVLAYRPGLDAGYRDQVPS
jgi:hypothetical protein